MVDPAFSEFTAHAAPAEPLRDVHRLDAEELAERLSRTMLRTIVGWKLIEEGDRILVAVSGGKDSYTMLDLLERARKKSPVRFELLAFHLDQGQPGYDGASLRAWLEASGIPFLIHREDTYSMVLDQVEGTGKAYCGPCSRFRRGIIYTQAERLGCTKIALGHHRDDALETLLMNLFWGGKTQAMPATYRTQDDRYAVIRPLIECDQESIAAYAARRAFPILPCNLCGSQDGLKRQKVRAMIAVLEVENPNVKNVMMAALRNVRPTHLLDAEVLEAWNQLAPTFEPRR